MILNFILLILLISVVFTFYVKLTGKIENIPKINIIISMIIGALMSCVYWLLSFFIFSFYFFALFDIEISGHFIIQLLFCFGFFLFRILHLLFFYLILSSINKTFKPVIRFSIIFYAVTIALSTTIIEEIMALFFFGISLQWFGIEILPANILIAIVLGTIFKAKDINSIKRNAALTIVVIFESFYLYLIMGKNGSYFKTISIIVIFAGYFVVDYLLTMRAYRREAVQIS